MKKNTFVANVIVWAALAVASIGFLIWGQAVGNDFGDNTALLAAAVYARPVAAFSVGALVTTLLVKFLGLKLGRGARLAWRILGIVPTVLFAFSPLAIPLLPDTAATVFAVVLLVAIAVMLFMSCAAKERAYEFLESEPFETGSNISVIAEYPAKLRYLFAAAFVSEAL